LVLTLQNVPDGQSRLVVQLEDDWQEPAALQKSPAGHPRSSWHKQEPEVMSQTVFAGHPAGVQTHRWELGSWMKPVGQQASPEQMQARTEAL
jgi:hypothetical protein